MLQSIKEIITHLEIEDKESYKWLLSAQQSQRCLACGGATMTTHIGDRESDLFEEFATVPDEHNHILIRACQDRRLLGQSVLLYEYLSQQPCEGTYTINVPADVRAGRAAILCISNGSPRKSRDSTS